MSGENDRKGFGPQLGLRPLVEAAEDESARGREQSEARRAKRRALSRTSKKAGVWIGSAIAGLGILTGGAMAWEALRPIDEPEVFQDPFDDVLSFALLQKDFNRLPLQERLRLAKEIAERFRSLDSSGSALVAAFAAGIRGAAREQLEENMRTLFVDVLDSFAERYARMSPEEQEENIDGLVLEMFEMVGELRPDEGPEESQPADESMEQVQEMAKRRADRVRAQGGVTPDTERAAEFLREMGSMMGDNVEPNRRARMTRFMRDAGRAMRGDDPS